MAKQRRVYRVAEQIRNLIASELLAFGDERLRLATITSVVTSKDLSHAKIYWTVSGGADARSVAEDAFEHVNGHLRKVLANSLEMRSVPTLAFYYDETLDTVENVNRLLERIKREDASKESE